MSAELEIRDLRLEYVRRSGERLTAIDGLTCQVRRGEFLSLLGPSGCGKTTLLKVAGGLLPATAGSVLLRGTPVRAPRRDVAFVFQEASLFPWFTLERNIGYGLECRGVPTREARARVGPYLDLVGLRGFESHYPYELSGGMQQRANLARALAVEPDVLLMDEPFASLDAQTRELMQAELLDIWRRSGQTVLFVTHQIAEAIYLSDRILVMSARPTTIVDEITVDLPRPRDLGVKRTEAFLAHEDRIWRRLESEARRSMQAERENVGDEPMPERVEP